MSAANTPLTPELGDYLRSISLREPDTLRKLRAETAQLPAGGMQITPEQGQFMRMLVQILNAKKALEVGVFTGYSSCSVGLGLPADGKLVACDISAEWTSVAQRYWKELGLEHRIELHLGPALQTLERFISNGEGGTYDFIFIDADKENYKSYFECALVLVRHRGLIAIDNVLWHGRVADPVNADAETNAIRRFNEQVLRDERVAVSTIPIGDGLTLAMRL